MELLKIKTIKVDNFGLYKDLELDCEDKDVIGILAEYVDSPFRSNRAGKSLLIELIRYNLTGLQRFKKTASIIHRGEKSCMTDIVYISTSGKEYRVRRGVTAKGEGSLTLDWIEKSRESQEAINELFGISKEDFDLTLFFKQSDINRFMDLGAAGKTDHIMNWVDNKHWQSKENLVKEDEKVTKNMLRDGEALVKALSMSSEVEEDLDVELSGLRKDLKKIEGTIKKRNIVIKQGNDKLAEEKAEMNNSSKNLEYLNKTIRMSKGHESKIKTIKGELKGFKEDLNDLDKSDIVDVPPIEDIIKKISDSKSRLREIKREVDRLSENEGGLCPILKESCDRIKPDKKYLDKIKKESNTLKSSIKKLESKKLDVKKIEEDNAKITVLNNNIDVAENELSSLSTNPWGKTSDLQRELDNLSVTDITSKISDLEDDILELRTQLAEEESKKTGYVQRIAAIEQKKKDAIETLKKINEAEKRNVKIRKKLSVLQYIRMMFSKNGIPAAEIENIFGVLEDDINDILKSLDVGFSCSFSPDTEINKKEPICVCGHKFVKGYKKSTCPDCGQPRMKQRKEEISLKILEHGEEADFEGDSGGGKTVFSYAVRVAVTLLKRRQNKCKLNILLLDEVDTALDKHLANTIISNITKLLTRKLGYDQIFMISHKDEIKESVPHIIKVIRHEKHSTASFI